MLNCTSLNKIAMVPLEKSYSLLNCTKGSSIGEVRAGYKKKVIAYSSSTSGIGRLEEVTQAFIDGSEDPESAQILQKCEEYVPGQIRVRSGLLVIKTKYPANIWRKAVKAKFPGAININPRFSRRYQSPTKHKSRASESRVSSYNGAKYVLTWRPSNDYVHLKVNILVTEQNLQITGPSYLLWAIENYASLSQLADDIAAKEEESDDLPNTEAEKMDEILKCLRGLGGEISLLHETLDDISSSSRTMKTDVDDIGNRLENIELNQDKFAKEMKAAAESWDSEVIHSKLDDLGVKCHEIRQLAGAKAMAEGKSASAILVKNPAPPPIGRKGRGGKDGGSPKKKKSTAKRAESPAKRISKKELNKTNRMEVVENDTSGYQTNSNQDSAGSGSKRNGNGHGIDDEAQEVDDERIENDDMSTNEMYGSSILSNDGVEA